MRVKHLLGPIPGVLMLSVPVVALLALSPWGSTSQASFAPGVAQLPTAVFETAADQQIVDLAGWDYTKAKAKVPTYKTPTHLCKIQKTHFYYVVCGRPPQTVFTGRYLDAHFEWWFHKNILKEKNCKLRRDGDII